MKPQAQYYGGRVLAVASRPAFLFISNNYLSPAAAQGLAVAFLASSLALVAIALDPHRRFYARRFAVVPVSSSLSFYVYATALALLMVAGAALVGAIALRHTPSTTLALACAGYFVSEKVVDEMLRFRLFEGDLETWGRSMIRRTVLQAILFGALVATLRSAVTPGLAIVALTAGNLGAFLPQVPSGIARALLRPRLRTQAWLMMRAAKALVANRLYWAISVLGTGVGYLDRLVALLVDPALLPVFGLVVMCFSITQMSVDFFYLSRYRREFLQHLVTVREALTSRHFLESLLAGLLLAGVACFLVLRLARNGSGFPLTYVLFVGVLQAAVAVTGIPREISYWNHPVAHILRVEVVFWVLAGTAAVGGRLLGFASGQVLLIAAGCAVLRLALHVALANRAGSGGPLDAAVGPDGVAVVRAP